eukprot:XP_001690303.1 topoisomerase [Chlamydomonas reinhardtii]
MRGWHTRASTTFCSSSLLVAIIAHVAFIAYVLETVDTSATPAVVQRLLPCPAGCEKRGNCDAERGVCQCPWGWDGPACEHDRMAACKSTSRDPGFCGSTVPKNCECYRECYRLYCPARSPWTGSDLEDVCTHGAGRGLYRAHCYLYNRRVRVDSGHPANDSVYPADLSATTWFRHIPEVEGGHRYRNSLKAPELAGAPGKWEGSLLRPAALDECADRCSEGQGVCVVPNPDSWGRTCAELNPEAAFPGEFNDADSYRDPIYIAYEQFLTRFLNDSTVRTENPYEATLFYVPLLAYWYGANVGPGHLQDRPIKLVHFGLQAARRPRSSITNNADYAPGTMPYLKAYFCRMCSHMPHRLAAAGGADAERTTLLFFAGSLRTDDREYSGGARQAVAAMLAALGDRRPADVEFVEGWVGNYGKHYRAAHFCLAPCLFRTWCISPLRTSFPTSYTPEQRDALRLGLVRWHTAFLWDWERGGRAYELTLKLRGPPPAGHTQQPPATRAPALGPAPAYAPPATNPGYPPPAYPSPAAPGAYPLPLALSTYPPDDSSALDTPAAPPPPALPHPRRPAFPPWPPFRPRAPKLVTPADDDQLPPGVEVAADPPVAACAAWHVAAAGDTCAALADSYGLPYGSGLYLNGPYSSGAGGSTAASTSGGGSAGADAGSSDAAAGSGPGPGWTWLQRINPRLDCAAGPQPGAALCVHRAQQWPPPPGGCARAHVLADGQSCDQAWTAAACCAACAARQAGAARQEQLGRSGGNSAPVARQRRQPPRGQALAPPGRRALLGRADGAAEPEAAAAATRGGGGSSSSRRRAVPERATPVGVGGAVPEYAGDEEEEEEGGWAGGGSNERSLLGSQGAGALAYARVVVVLDAVHNLLRQLLRPPLFASVRDVNAAVSDVAALLAFGLVFTTPTPTPPPASLSTGPAGRPLPGDLTAIGRLGLQLTAGYGGGGGVPCVLVTAKGVPDIATRAFAARLAATFPGMQPVGLVDFNPAGVVILATYKYGSDRMGPEGRAHPLPRLRWLGVRGRHLAGVGEAHLQRLTARDTALIRSLRERLSAAEPGWVAELDAMEQAGYKGDIEALYHAAGGDTGGEGGGSDHGGSGEEAATVELLIKLGANPNSVTDCGLPCPLAVLCAKITPEEQRALFQVLKQHRCTTFNSRLRSARNEEPCHITCKVLDLSDWTAPRKVEGVGEFKGAGAGDEDVIHVDDTNLVLPVGLLAGPAALQGERLLPRLPLRSSLFLSALSESWMAGAWRHSEERQHTVTQFYALACSWHVPPPLAPLTSATSLSSRCAAAAAVRAPRHVGTAAAEGAGRERLRDLLDSNVLDFVDGRNLEQVEAALMDLVGALSALPDQQEPDQEAEDQDQDDKAGATAPSSPSSSRLEAQLQLVWLESLAAAGRPESELVDDPEVWRAEAAVEAAAAIRACLLSSSSSRARELPPGVAFVEVVAARVMSQPEWGFSRGLLLQLGVCQMRRMMRQLHGEDDVDGVRGMLGQIQVLAATPASADPLHGWLAGLRGALAAASGCEQQRLYVVADCPARAWPAWLPALRAAVAAAVLGAVPAHPGNLYGRALLMQLAGKQVSRALLRSPRYGLTGAARTADYLAAAGYPRAVVSALHACVPLVLECAADAAAALLDPRTRAEEVERCEVLVGWLASDSQLLTGLAALRQLPPAAGLALPPHHYAHTHPYTAPGGTADDDGEEGDEEEGAAHQAQAQAQAHEAHQSHQAQAQAHQTQAQAQAQAQSHQSQAQAHQAHQAHQAQAHHDGELGGQGQQGRGHDGYGGYGDEDGEDAGEGAGGECGGADGAEGCEAAGAQFVYLPGLPPHLQRVFPGGVPVCRHACHASRPCNAKHKNAVPQRGKQCSYYIT